MKKLDYYCEAVAESFDEHGITATDEQIKAVAADMELTREGESLAFYTPENPMIRENADLKRKLDIEQRKIGCRACGGSGRDRHMAGPWYVDTQCVKCRGEGKVLP